MRLSDGLKQKRAELLDRLEALAKAAETESRLLSDTEEAAWRAGMAEIKAMDAKIAAQTQAEELLRGAPAQPLTGGGPALITDDGRVLRTLRNTDKLVDLLPRGTARPEVRVGHVLRGIVAGDWRGVGRPLEQTVGGSAPPPRAVGENVWSPAVFPVPESISNAWLDMARAASVCFQAGAVTLPMPTASMRIVGVASDPTFTWRKEHAAIPESDITLGPIDLKAKLCGAIVRTSIELIEDSPVAMDLIETVLMRAAAAEIDKALLAGDGTNTGDLDEPVGLLNWPGVPSVDAVVPPTSYDQLIDAYASVLGANGVPTAMISGAAMMATMAKVKTGLAGDNTTLEAPEPIASLPKYFTSVMPADTSVVGDFAMLAWALRTGMTMEVTRVGGDATFKQAQILIRLYFRGDTAVLRPSWFAKVAPATP